MMLISVGTGARPTSNGDVRSPDKHVGSNLAELPGALMYGSLVDQDINCRVVGRCVSGAPIDRELGDMIPPEALEQDLNRAFLYARYDAELTHGGLQQLDLGHLDPGKLTRLDAVDQIDNLAEIGRRIGRRDVRMDLFRRFVG